jgi:tetratricopeptide (TPR) repeat protein/TolB-like protein
MIGETIAHYEILEKLGEGGMGVVYKALDIRLQRLVALKFLPHEIVASPARIQRFQAEARAVSSLNHPNVATIHAMDEDDGRRFLVLEYLSGGTLRSRMQTYAERAEEFPVPEAIRIMAAVADGLSHAHRNGVVHRDLKPENIMFTEEGVPRITDFGLAKSVGGSEITTEGVTIGTVPYMAPEQAVRGETGPRGDLFALGVVLYEMLSGARPFAGQTDFSTLHAIVNDQPPRLRHVRPAAPAALDRIVHKLLEKDPERRMQSAEELAAELYGLAGFAPAPQTVSRDSNATRTLTRFVVPTGRFALKPRRRRWIPAALTAAVLLAGAAGWYGWKLRSSGPGIMQLAVLPFNASSGSTEDARFARDIADRLAGKLAAIGPNVSVTPESDLRGRHIKSAAEAYRAFGVRQVLTGEVRRGPQTQVDLRLIDAGSEKITGSASVTSSGPDLDESVLREASVLIGLPRDPLDAARLRVNAKTATAYDYYDLGRRYLERYDKPGYIDQAIAQFNKAIQRDPNYALAWAARASAWWRDRQFLSDKNAIDPARRDAAEAMARNEKLALPHVVLGAMAVQAGAIENGITELKKAIDLEPVSADAWRELGTAYAAAGRPADAETSYQQAIRYSLNSWMGYSELGAFYNRRQQYKKAEEALNAAASLAPDNYIVYRSLGGVEMALNEWLAAEQHLRRAIDLRPSGSVYSALGSLYIYMGRFDDAIKVSRLAVDSASSGRNSFAIWCNLGDAYKFAGGHDEKALDAWRKAIQIGRDRLAMGSADAALESEIAVYEAKAGDTDAARSRLAAARAKSPENGEILFNAAIISELNQRRREALNELREALKNGYSRNLVEREPELAALRKDPAYSAMLGHL